jgi:hypothetical protein
MCMPPSEVIIMVYEQDPKECIDCKSQEVIGMKKFVFCGGQVEMR